MKKTREANIELLRIIGMFMIVISHCIQHSSIISDLSAGNYFAVRFLYLIVRSANAVFILASGYFSIHAKFNITKILKLWGKTLFYSVGIYVIYCILDIKPNTYATFFPILSGEYWFITAYIAIYFLSPIISLLVNQLTKNQFKYLLIVMFAFFVVINMIFNPYDLFAGIGAFLCCYLLGAYIRLHVKIKKEKEYYFLKAVIVYMITLTIGILIEFLFNTYGEQKDVYLSNNLLQIWTKIYDLTNIGLIMIAMFIFLKFRTFDIKNVKIAKIINFVSVSLFSVYLIHENVNNRWLWKRLFNPLQYGHSPLLIGYIFVITLGVFVVCLCIDFIRRGLIYVIQKVPLISQFMEKIGKKLDTINTKVNTYLS